MKHIFLLALWSTIAAAQTPSLTGVWQGERAMGSRRDTITLRLKSSGDKLEGSLRNNQGEIPIEAGTFDGVNFSFRTRPVFPPGMPAQETKGKLDGAELVYTMQFGMRPGGMGPGGPGGMPPGGPSGPGGAAPRPAQAAGAPPGGPGGPGAGGPPRGPVEIRLKRVSSDPEPFLRELPRATPPAEPLKPVVLAATPPMGWNSWNHFRTQIDDKTIREVASAIVDKGLKDAGYLYINIDDGWQGARGQDGVLRPNERFPDMKALADFVHSKGLKLGIYSSPGPRTCGGFEGSWGHEEQDARMFAGWGIDFLKYDWCSAGQVWDLPRMGDAYAKMGRALRSTGRDIVYSLCQYGMFNVGEWGHLTGGNLWRTTFDIRNAWTSVAEIGFAQNGREKSAGPGRFNDPDMIEIGNGGMNADEERSHFTLWSILAAPLLLGNDIRTMAGPSLEIVSNRDVIAVNQDRLGKQGYRAHVAGTTEVWVKPLQKGEWAVALFNRGDAPAQVDVAWKEIGLSGSPRVRDLWTGKDRGKVHGGFAEKLPAHGSALFRVAP